MDITSQSRDYNRSLTQVYNVAPLIAFASRTFFYAPDLLAWKMAAGIVTRL